MHVQMWQREHDRKLCVMANYCSSINFIACSHHHHARIAHAITLEEYST